MTGPTVHVAGTSWTVHPDEADGLVDRLHLAAQEGLVERVRVLTADGEEGELLVSPAAVPVVVTGGGAPPDPVETFPQR